jgi:hypothetical protein
MVFSALLVDGSRMVSAKAMTQEASDLAIQSALAAYDEKLKQEFGLMALDNKADVEAIFKEYLQDTLSASNAEGDQSYSDRLYNFSKSSLGMGESRYAGKKFLNLYDFSLESSKVTPMYSLANHEVLGNQIVEYSKYRGLYILAERLGFLNRIDEIQEKEEENEKAASIIEEKMQIDQKNAEVDQKIKEINELIPTLNYYLVQINEIRDDYRKALFAQMEVISLKASGEVIDPPDRIQSTSDTLDEQEDAVIEYYKKLESITTEILTKATTAKKLTLQNIQRLEEFQAKYKNDDSETVQQLMGDAKEEIDMYHDYYFVDINKLLGNETLFAINSSDLVDNFTSFLKDTRERIEKYEDEMKGEDKTYYYYLDESIKTASELKAYYTYTEEYDALKSKIDDKYVDPIHPADEYSEASLRKTTADNKAADMNEKKAEQIGTEANAKSSQSAPTDTRERQKLSDSVYAKLPSKTFDPQKEAASYGGLISNDIAEIEDNNTTDLSYSFDTDSGLGNATNLLDKGTSFLADLGEASRDKALTISYICGTFKTRMTGDPRFTANAPEANQTAPYLTGWRYLHKEGEWDLTFQPKKDRQTKLTAETEYIIYGFNSDSKNEAAVYATIMGSRFANNLIAYYMNTDFKNACRAASLVASAACEGIIPPTVFFWIFMSAMATAETIQDMGYLIDEGYKIPLIKTKNNTVVINADGATGIKNYERDKFIDVCYEDYLALFLLCKSDEKTLMRVADLVEMNMQLQEKGFKMAKSFTYLRADSKLSIRFLFNSTPQFAEGYEELQGRIPFRNVIYQGY